MKKIITGFLLLLLLGGLSACKKFLDEKPDAKLVLPESITDLWAIMDHINVMFVNDPWVDEMSADNIYFPPAVFNSLSEPERNIYLWKKENLYPNSNNWSQLYSKVYYANTVLEQLAKIERTPQTAMDWDNLKGHALMVRGKAFLQAVLIWAKAYNNATAATDLGIPLRLNTNFAEVTTRASLQDTYAQIIRDFKAAIPLLSNSAIAQTRASMPAAYAFLARTFLAMRQYSEAGLYADSSLKIYNTLLDYNTLNAAASLPIPKGNAEMLFLTSSFTLGLSTNYARIDSTLYNSYSTADCRKTVFFKPAGDGSYQFKGTYLSANGNFAGIATDEVYLMRAEAYARGGNKEAALADLNMLLINRYKPGFVPVTATSAEAALEIILTERRKELVLRGLRWMDIKRLNKDGAGIVLKRKMNGEDFLLPPNSSSYALPIPDYVIEIAQIPQNP